MTDQEINRIVNSYVESRLSPKPDECAYIKEKYGQLRELLDYRCFRSGSYPRLTANHPVHDLDVIYVVDDPALQDDPVAYTADLKKRVENSDISNIKRVSAQTHSLQVEFDDGKTDFTMDIVPVIETNEMNEYGQPIYIVPEILQLNDYHREDRYKNAGTKPLEWIKSDPRGYIHANRLLNKVNPGFRIATKLGKGWRHACKVIYNDGFRFKSFHFELMFHDYFLEFPSTTTVDAIIDCIGRIPEALEKPQFRDRADDTRFIDGYVTEITPPQQQLLLKLQTTAHSIVTKLPGCDSEHEIISLLDELMQIQRESSHIQPVASAVAQPHKLWAC